MPKGSETYVIRDGQNQNKDELEVDISCGYGSCKPEALQKLNNPKMMIIIMSIYVAAQGFFVNGIFNVNVSSLERRFHISSTDIGLVAAAYDFSAAFFGLFASYFGSAGNKPRWLTASAVCLTLGSMLMALPHYTTGPYEWGEQTKQTCDIYDNSTTTCVESQLQSYVGVFALSMVIFGLGGAILYTIGTTYIDDSVTALMSPVYMSIFFGCAALGPGLGYVIGGVFLATYVDFDTVHATNVTLTPLDRRWVGAWWIGSILSMCLFIVSAFALSCFGVELPSAKVVRESRVSQLHKGVGTKLNVSSPTRPGIKELPKVLLALLKNPPFLFTTLAGITESMYLSGVSTFTAKFIQNTFNLSASTSGVYGGFAVILGLTLGMFFGGFTCRCFKLKVKGMLKFCIGTCLISTCCVVLFWASCDQMSTAGVNAVYPGSSRPDVSISSTCNKDCRCTTENLELSCDSNGVQYFSPCYAGCNDLAENKTFTNCSCTASANTTRVTPGGCKTSCSLLYVFLILLFLITFTTIAADIPAEQAVLRCIDENHRVIMTGTNRFFIRLLGTVPGAIIFGSLTDAGCLVWEYECGKQASCWIYDDVIVKRNYFIFGIVTKACSLVFFFCAMWFYQPPRPDDTNVTIQNADNLDKNKTFTNKAFQTDVDSPGTRL